MRTKTLIFLALLLSSVAANANKKIKHRIDSMNQHYYTKPELTISDSLTLSENIKKAKSIDYYDGVIETLTVLIEHYVYQSDHKNVKELVEICIEYLPKSDNKLIYGNANIAILKYLQSVGELDAMVEYIYNAKDALEKINHPNQYKVYNFLAYLSEFKGDYATALKYYRIPLKFYLKTGDFKNLAKIYANITYSFQSTKQNDSAEFYFLKAAELAKDQKDYNRLARNYVNFGFFYSQIGNMQKSDYYFRQAFHMGDSLGDMEITAKSLFNMGKNSMTKKQYDSAINFFNKSRKICKNNNIEYTWLISLRYSSEAFEKQMRYDSALYYRKLYSRHKDSVFSEDKKHLITQMEKRFKLESTLQEKAAKERIMLLIIIIVALSSIILLYLGYFLYKKLKRNYTKIQVEKRKLKTELDQKNRELASYVLNLININEKKIQLSKKMLANKSKLSKENQPLIDQFAKELDEDYFQNIWQEFEVRFNQVHNSFYTNLHNNHPDLTKNEKRLCAFLYLDLSTKEISGITYQSQRAVEAARVRLRKKLNLTNTKMGITQYLQSMED